MKTSHLTPVFLMVLLLTACTREQDQPASGEGESSDTNATLDPSATPGGQYAPTEGSAITERDIEMVSLRDELFSWENQIGKLAQRVNQLGDRAGSESRAALADLQSHLASLEATMNHVKDQSEETWEEFKSKVESGFDELKKSFEKLSAQLPN